MRDKIHFAHGNGFPSSCYRQLFNCLESRYECSYIDKVGHNPAYPITENWDFLVDELVDSIKEKFSQPVIGVGHSLGGVLNMLAAIKDPSLFKAIIMIDSPLLGRFKSRMVYLAKSLGFIDQLTPASRTRGRRTHWDERSQLVDYLRSRPLFKTFSQQCLEDYINFGFKKTPAGYKLLFDRDIEYLIFRTLPHHLPRYEGKLEVPTALIYGNNSSVVKNFDIRYMEKKYRIATYCVKGTHMLPFEDPIMVGKQIFKILDDFSRYNCS